MIKINTLEDEIEMLNSVLFQAEERIKQLELKIAELEAVQGKNK